MQTAAVAQLKKAVRREQLKRLRAWAKAEPEQLRFSSQLLCEHLCRYIHSRRSPLSSPGEATSPLFVLAYLPLFYEVDLVPLLQRLWPMAAARQIHVLAPVVLPSSTAAHVRAQDGAAVSSLHAQASVLSDPLSSAMVFVEVLDEADLQDAFAPQGDFNIREFPRAVLEPWLRGPEFTTRATRDVHTPAEVASVEGREGRVRHMILCDRYARLFPESHAAGYRPAGLLEYADDAPTSPSRADGHAAAPLSSLEDVSLLVLTPGVLFDAQTGHRLGKGRGYYDRFLKYHARHHAQDGVTKEEETRDARWEVVAAAFDSQVLHSAAAAQHTPAEGLRLPEAVPVDECDQLVHAVVTPSGGVERVRGASSRAQKT